MKYNILIILIISLFINQLRTQITNCPAGSQTAAGAETVAAAADIANCNMCKSGFYHVGNPAFDAGDANNGQCTPCPKALQNGQATAGNLATLVNQCDVRCPTGTVINGGAASYDNAPAQCANCAPNHYSIAPNNFQAGVSECTPCPVNLQAGAVLFIGGQATIARQCDVRCPTNTQISGGQTSYVNASSECVNCQPNHYFGGPGSFNAGTSACTACPAGGNKPDGAVAKAGNEALITTQCNVACPKGTVNADGASNWVAASTDCANCGANYYYSGNAFAAGNTECTACPINKDGSKLTAGSNAKLATQCKVECPAGTVIDDGTSSNYVNAIAECTKCAANFFQSKTTGMVAGTDGCTECTKKLTTGAQAKLLAEATQKVQCASSSTFAKFLSISLLFISFYLL
uniref:Putative immobilization antigen isoform n=1 Tax=Ichthyophthirius multifiliis TaxID=5932 RepID=A0A7G7YAI1_ICHMU|nr:putative immobilization antigen isoform [Ichthyophthirius multifiliis]